ncbi:GNAT family N-acetyltransferase [bacterium]|nr:GNAT family N-acetyltransferase [bacterium]
MNERTGRIDTSASAPRVKVRALTRRIPARTVVVRHLSELESVRSEWAALQSQLPTPSPLRSFDYARLWYQSFAEPEQVRVFQISDAERSLGLFPMVVRRVRGARVLSGITNSHCLHGEPLVVPGQETAFSDHLIREMIAHKSDWDLIDHRFTYSFDRVRPVFDERGLSRHGLRFAQRTEPTYVTDVEQPYEDFFKGLSRETRKKLRRSGDRLARMGEASYVHLRDDDAVAAWDVLVTLEDAGWKGRNGTSIARCGSQYTEFYESFVRLLADNRVLHLFQLCVDGQPIAAAFGYLDGGTMHYLKAAYDENAHEAAPSNNLLRDVIQDLIENYPDVKLLHQFPWDSGYKHRMASYDAHSFETIVFSPTIRGGAMAMMFRLKERLKQVNSVRNTVVKIRGY